MDGAPADAAGDCGRLTFCCQSTTADAAFSAARLAGSDQDFVDAGEEAGPAVAHAFDGLLAHRGVQVKTVTCTGNLCFAVDAAGGPRR